MCRDMLIDYGAKTKKLNHFKIPTKKFVSKKILLNCDRGLKTRDELSFRLVELCSGFIRSKLYLRK